VAAEAGAGDQAHCHVTLRSGVAVATLQAEIDCSVGSERGEVPVGEDCWQNEASEYVEQRPSLRILHQRQVDEILDSATSEPRPDPLVLGARRLFGRMRRPLDPDML
jgi:hypothetical protein